MALVSALCRSLTAEEAPREHAEALAQLRADRRLWQHARPSILDPSGGAVRVTFCERGLVGASRHAPLHDGAVQRAVVVARDMWGSPESHEMSLLEVAHALLRERVPEVRYAVPRSHAHSLRRGARLGWRAVGRHEDLLLYALNEDDLRNHLGLSVDRLLGQPRSTGG